MADSTKTEGALSEPVARSGSLFGRHPGSARFSPDFDPNEGALDLQHDSERKGVDEQPVNPARPKRLSTSKQMGDACEMLVASEMTFAGIPAMKMPDNWPGYDVIAQRPDGSAPQRVSVKSRTFERGGDTFVTYKCTDKFDWLAVVLLPGDDQEGRRIFIIPRDVAVQTARRDKAIGIGARTKSPNALPRMKIISVCLIWDIRPRMVRRQ